MPKKLRIAEVIVQPVLKWDDGNELTQGPAVQPVGMPLSQVSVELAKMPRQLSELEAQLLAAEAPASPNRAARRRKPK